MIRLLVAGLITFSVALAAATDGAADRALLALERQSQPLPLSLQFRQEKQLTGLPRALVSSGLLAIDTDEIVWTTEQPQQQQLTINRQGIFEQGNEESVSGSDTIAQLLLAILQQDEAVLKEQFELSLKQDCVVMTPKADTLASVIEKIHSCGVDSVERVELFEQNGNITRIELSKR